MGDKETDVNARKQQPHEMHNSELVSKLMAATPSYFFTPPQTGHNFFFSELLRSLVQKRKADELTSVMKTKNVTKKVRKPSGFYQAKAYEPEYKRQKLSEPHMRVTLDTNENDDPKTTSPNLKDENSQDSVINVDKDDSPPAQPPTAILPHSILPQPPSSAFYPYVDPLHFFIDLRVSAGQVNDRKKEAYQALKNNHILLDSNTWNNPIISKNRIGSAFKVPNTVSNDSTNTNFSAINLIANNNSTTELKHFQKHHSGDDSASEKNDDDVEIFDLETKSEFQTKSD